VGRGGILSSREDPGTGDALGINRERQLQNASKELGHVLRKS